MCLLFEFEAVFQAAEKIGVATELFNTFGIGVYIIYEDIFNNRRNNLSAEITTHDLTKLIFLFDLSFRNSTELNKI